MRAGKQREKQIPSELERYGAAVDDALAKRTRREKRKLEDRSRYEQSFPETR